MEVFTPGLSHPPIVERMATAAEAAGYDGMYVVDSQNLAGDSFVALALAARATTDLLLGTGVTNPATRHPVATAAGIASVHAASKGRAFLGIGRGDSALAHLGLAPAAVHDLKRYVSAVRAYLGGESIPFSELEPHHRPGARPLSALGLADAPTGSRLHWLDSSLPRVPVEVVASGPRMLSMAASSADRVLLAFGADLQRVAWAIERVRATNSDVPIGSFVNVVVHDDLEVGRRLAAGAVATFARFSVMDGKVRVPADSGEKAALTEVHGAYEMTRHGQNSSAQAERMDARFVDRFAVIGPARHCIERLEGLAAAGVDRLIVAGASMDADPTEAKRAREAFVAEVLPALKQIRG